MKIIYNSPEKGFTLLIPSPNWSGTLDELAQKDVPTGLKYKIVEDSDLPDNDFFGAWEVDESDLTDGVGA